MDSEKISIFQALGKAGDLTLTASRDNVILIREVNGVNQYYRFDLTSARLLNEEYFYLQQNDVLYVSPSAKRIRAATTNTGLWSLAFSTITTVLSVITLVINLSSNN